MLRLWLVPAVCCALCLGCGKSDEGQNAPGAGQPANQGQHAAHPMANANAQANSGAPAGPASSNPTTNFFRGLDRAAKGTGGGQR